MGGVTLQGDAAAAFESVRWPYQTGSRTMSPMRRMTAGLLLAAGSLVPGAVTAAAQSSEGLRVLGCRGPKVIQMPDRERAGGIYQSHWTLNLETGAAYFGIRTGRAIPPAWNQLPSGIGYDLPGRSLNIDLSSMTYEWQEMDGGNTYRSTGNCRWLD